MLIWSLERSHPANVPSDSPTTRYKGEVSCMQVTSAFIIFSTSHFKVPCWMLQALTFLSLDPDKSIPALLITVYAKDVIAAECAISLKISPVCYTILIPKVPVARFCSPKKKAYGTASKLLTVDTSPFIWNYPSWLKDGSSKITALVWVTTHKWEPWLKIVVANTCSFGMSLQMLTSAF